jgi:hypothetical protein
VQSQVVYTFAPNTEGKSERWAFRLARAVTRDQLDRGTFADGLTAIRRRFDHFESKKLALARVRGAPGLCRWRFRDRCRRALTAETDRNPKPDDQ